VSPGAAETCSGPIGERLVVRRSRYAADHRDGRRQQHVERDVGMQPGPDLQRVAESGFGSTANRDSD